MIITLNCFIFINIINMNKILLIGDTHLGMAYPNNYIKWFNTSKIYFEKFLIPIINDELDENDVIVHLGDLFDNRNIIPIDILNYAQSLLEKLSSICPVHILIGNHDIGNKSTNDINTIKLYKYIPNIHIYEVPEKINLFGKSVLMLPWVEKRKDQIEYLKEYSGCDYLFCHSDLNGAKMHLTSVAHKNNDKINVEDFIGYNHVYSGHIHLYQKVKQFTFVGSTYQMDRNDIDNQKGIFILDTKDETERFIPNNTSPVFKKVYIRTEEDIERLEDVSTRDYVDIFISNNLLINNRKLRRKLEVMLETGNFSSVEYIDDVSKKNDKLEIDITNTENEESEFSIKLEYDDIIRDWIVEQKWEPKVKNGVLQEFNEIIDIYKSNYKEDI